MPEVPSMQPDTESSNDRNVPGGSRPSKAALPPARLGRSLRRAGRSSWDRLGVVLLISLVGTVVLLLSLTLGLLVTHTLPGPLRTFCVALIAVSAVSPFGAASFDVALRIATHREITLPLLLQGLRQFGGVAIRLGLVHLIVTVLMALNVSFYVQLGGVPGGAAVVLCVYVVLFWSAMAVYQGPLLVLQEAGTFDEPDRPAKRGAKAVIRRSFFLVVGEPLYSLGLCLATLVWSMLTLMTAVGAVMLWFGGVCVLTTTATLALLAKYGVVTLADSADGPPTKEA